jgi:hypothetical protein
VIKRLPIKVVKLSPGGKYDLIFARMYVNPNGRQGDQSFELCESRDNPEVKTETLTTLLLPIWSLSEPYSFRTLFASINPVLNAVLETQVSIDRLSGLDAAAGSIDLNY